MKYCKAVVFLCAFVVAFTSFAQTVKRYYQSNKENIIREKYVVHGDYVYVAGTARKIASDDMAIEMAESDSMGQLINLVRNTINFSKIPVKPGKKLQDKIFTQIQLFRSFRYTAKSRIELASFIRGRYAYYVAAYKLSDIEFEDKTPLTWERIYGDFKNNPDKRDELLFFEIIPGNEESALKNIVENNIAKQYGKNFALMFMGKDVTPVPQKRYDIAKKASEKYNSKTSLRILTIAANTLPYDKKICALLTEKFEKMQMTRCTAIMKKRAEESYKLVVEPEKVTPKPEVRTSAVAEDVKAGQNTNPNPQAEKQPENKGSGKNVSASAVQGENRNAPAKKQPASNINFTNLL